MLKKRFFTLFGIVGPLTAMTFISLSIFLSQWFSWSENALSDLGHSINSPVAALFNFGLLLTGFFVILYSLISFQKYAKNTSYFLLAAGLSLQLIAMFDEVYGSLHTAVSVLFFVMLSLASISYAVEKKSILAVIAVIIGVFSWVLYGLDLFAWGIAVPEAVSSVLTASWVVKSAYWLWASDY